MPARSVLSPSTRKRGFLALLLPAQLILRSSLAPTSRHSVAMQLSFGSVPCTFCELDVVRPAVKWMLASQNSEDRRVAIVVPCWDLPMQL